MRADLSFLMAPLRPQQLVLYVALFLVVFNNQTCWLALESLVPFSGIKSLPFYLSFAVFLTAFISLLLSLVPSRYFLKPVLVLLLLCAAASAYFMDSYGITIDIDMLQNVFETNGGEALDLLNLRMFGYMLMLGVVPAVWVCCIPVVYAGLWLCLRNQVLMVLFCVGTILASVAPFYSTYASVFREEDKLTHFINPTNWVYAVGKYAGRHYGVREDHIVHAVGEDSRPGPKLGARPVKSLVIVVVGETARADHFSLNGYGRNTNPELQKLDILNYTDVHSCGTSTAISVPCMFSRFDRDDYSDKKGKTHEGVLDMVQRAGISVFWRDNNSDCKGTCLRVPHEDISREQGPPFCNDQRCLDESLLVGLQDYVDSVPGDALIVLHSDGSHGPEYFDRYPESMEKFKPVCRTNQLGSCTTEELVNVYDNTILYTDYFLTQVIAFLQRNESQRDTAMIYISDHGESLGENGLFLHAAPYSIAPEAQTHVPMIAWFSQDAYKHWELGQDCLMRSRENVLSHDNLFHSLLGLFDIQSREYDPSLDMFKPCRA